MTATPANEHYLRTLRFWRDAEFFQPFDLDAVVERNDGCISLRLNTSQSLPWQQPTLFGLDPEREYGYDFFYAPFAKSEIVQALSAVFPEVTSETFFEPRDYHGLSCFGRLSFGPHGELNSSDLSLSTLPWALARLCKRLPLQLAEFDVFAETYQSLLPTLGSPLVEESATLSAPRVLGLSALHQLAQDLAKDNPLDFFPEGLLGILVPYRLRKRKAQTGAVPPAEAAAPELQEAQELNDTQAQLEQARADFEAVRQRRKVDILNSFFLRDLERVAKAIKDEAAPVPQVLTRYMALEAPPERVNLLAAEGRVPLRAALSKQQLLAGRWPEVTTRALGLNQLYAVQRAVCAEASLTAVNGPPGTGKTTIVKDFVAAIVVERAKRLMHFTRPGDALQPSQHELQIGKRRYKYRCLQPTLCGFEIVVASSNNAAVENISRQMPLLKNIGEGFSELRYLAPMARSLELVLTGEHEFGEQLKACPEAQYWGLPSVALGNARNRKLLRTALFSRAIAEDIAQRQARVQQGVMTFFEWRKEAPPQTALSYQAARRAFQACLEALQRWQESDTSEPSGSELLETSAAELGSAELQLVAPWQGPEINRLRSELFCAALQLHEAWIREVPRFESELLALSGLLANPQGLNSQDARQLWHLFFMLIPVVSTTLASVERMFAPLTEESLGYVIIDEAGQALPQAGAGLLWRARRALVVGDQRQLEPIALLPKHLERKLAQGLVEQHWMRVSPLRSSLQSLADWQSAEGTYLGAREEQVWVGIPLCVHRRCARTIFEISNTIAYDNIMLYATRESAALPVLGESSWHQVRGAVLSKQWVPEQGHACAQLLSRLLAQTDHFPDIFFITPFRKVKQELSLYLAQMLKAQQQPTQYASELRRRIGTVHTFQGKEADFVCFVLGCDFSCSGAADWAGEKPNLVNVAITRARRALYVIGDANLWHNRGYFSDLQKALPLRGGYRG